MKITLDFLLICCHNQCFHVANKPDFGTWCPACTDNWAEVPLLSLKLWPSGHKLNPCRFWFYFPPFTHQASVFTCQEWHRHWGEGGDMWQPAGLYPGRGQSSSLSVLHWSLQGGWGHLHHPLPSHFISPSEECCTSTICICATLSACNH